MLNAMCRLIAVAALGAVAACVEQPPRDNPNLDAATGPRASGEVATGQALGETTANANVEETHAPSDGVQPESGQDALAQGADESGSDATAVREVDRAVISDEQDFEAVSSRETIESDRDRLQRQREALDIVEPGDLPTRPSGSEPNIVAYALSTTNAVGEAVYERSGQLDEARYNRVCTRFGWTDRAQVAFLNAGGPERDRRGLDPDGDGFACNWDPTPFRIVREGG